MACRSEFVPVITANLLAIAIVASVSVSPVLTDNGTVSYVEYVRCLLWLY